MRVLILLFFIISCGTYTPKPTIKHVLAVTSEGDTLLLPIDKIRPNIYRSIYPLYGSIIVMFILITELMSIIVKVLITLINLKQKQKTFQG